MNGAGDRLASLLTIRKESEGKRLKFRIVDPITNSKQACLFFPDLICQSEK